jgi:hypothetical protein
VTRFGSPPGITDTDQSAGQRRNKVPSPDERNVMKSGVLWDEAITALRAREYPDVEPFAISNNTEGSQPDTTKQIRGSKA